MYTARLDIHTLAWHPNPRRSPPALCDGPRGYSPLTLQPSIPPQHHPSILSPHPALQPSIPPPVQPSIPPPLPPSPPPPLPPSPPLPPRPSTPPSLTQNRQADRPWKCGRAPCLTVELIHPSDRQITLGQ
ncbi:unnamed protein product [Arctogadus glacialis]